MQVMSGHQYCNLILEKTPSVLLSIGGFGAALCWSDLQRYPIIKTCFLSLLSQIDEEQQWCRLHQQLWSDWGRVVEEQVHRWSIWKGLDRLPQGTITVHKFEKVMSARSFEYPCYALLQKQKSYLVEGEKEEVASVVYLPFLCGRQ